jgi:nitrate/nitrite transport system substrate-binding protein
MRAAWVDKHPNAAKALLMAVMEAQQWCEKMENRDEVAAICAKRQWINVPVADVADRMKGKFDYGTGRVVESSPHIMKYWRDHASYPFQSHDLWFLTEDIRWGKLEPSFDTKALIRKVNREDLWRETAAALGVPAAEIPASTSRGKETFFDGKVFDPADPAAYLKSLPIKRVEV